MNYNKEELINFVRKYITYTEKRYITYSADVEHIDDDNEVVYLLTDKEIDGFSAEGVWECNICDGRIREEEIIDHFLYHKKQGDLEENK